MSTKRWNGEGNIRKRTDGRWEARLTLDDGARKSFYGRSRQEVVHLLATALRDRELGIIAVGEQQTLRQYLGTWLIARQHQVKPRTWRRAAEYVHLHLVPALGSIQLTKLTAQQVEALYAKKLDDGLSPTTVHHLHEVLHCALSGALRLGLVQRNVTDLLDPPRMARREMTTLSEDQVRILLATAHGSRLEALYVLALSTGMRLGELLALKWRDVDLEGRSLRVCATLQYTRDGYVFADPKTAHSRRRVALSETAGEALRHHRARQAEERLKMGAVWDDLDLVFPNTCGRPLDGTNLLKYWFRPLLAQAALPRIRFHDLRHTAATLLLSRGVNPKIVSEMLGHSSVATTLDIYSHVTPHMQDQAAAAMDAAFGH